jgi:hypothetical protein
LRRNIPRDAIITYDDVVLRAARLADRLRGEQYRKFRGETWLDDLLAASQPIDQAAASARNRSDAPARLPRAISL